ncbi:MAG: magnesium transporter MgtE N-terminal domain-containing protein, partial [Phycisphaerae bacterium]
MASTATHSEALFEQLRGLLDRADDASLRQFFSDLHAADIADCLEQVSEEERSRIFFLLPPRTTAEAIVLLEEAVRSDVLDDLTDQEVSDVLVQLPADDAVDVLDELDDAVAEKVVERLPPEQKAAVEPLRQYGEDTAGGIMNTDFVSVPIGA